MSNILSALLEVNILSSIVIILVLAIKAIWNMKINRKIISLLWVLVLVRLVLPITIQSPVHIDSLFTEKAVAEFEAKQPDIAEFGEAVTDDLSVNTNNHEPINIENNTFEKPTAEVVTPTIIERIINFVKSISIWTYIFIVWLIGAIAIFSKRIIGYIDFSKRVSKGTKLNNILLSKTLIEVKKELGIKKNISILICEYISTPVTLRLLNPIILFPVGFIDNISQSKLKMILLHELCHVKRDDIFKNYVWLFAKSIHWFNPLVWIAYKSYLNDVEFTCDEMVLTYIDEEESFEYSQSLLDAIRLSKDGVNIPIAISFCKDKSKIRTRVENMIQPKRKSKSAGFIAIMLTIIMIIGCFTTACQKTPEELVVQNKAGDEMENLINATDNPDEPQNSGNSEIVVATDHITKKTINDLGTITVNVDTDVYMPNVNKLPVVTVERGSFTQDQVNKFIEVLMGNVTLYSTDSPLTKDQITEEIIKIKQSATDLNSDMAKSEGITSLSELEKRANELIEILEAKYASAPDSADNSIPDTDVTTQILYNGEGTGAYVNVSANLGKKDMAILSLSKFIKGEELAFSNYNNYGIKEHDIYSSVSVSSGIIEGFNMSYDDAQKLVTDTLSDLNLDKDFKLGNTYIGKSTNINDDENKQYYIFYFERVINDVAVTHDFRRIGKTSNEDPAYAEPLQFENLEMWVDDTGIVQVSWDAPLQINEVVNNNVEVKIDAEQATDVITKQLFLQYGDLYSGQAEKIEIEITGIRLGLARIRYRGNPGEYILVPVWDFYGDVKTKVNESASGQLIDELNKEGGLVHPKVDGMYIINIPLQSIGTINALDGTIINRDLGY